ncbi:MAG: DUF2268 domain-containing putative Zn-dependent protease [Acidobacteria bacterium]|nr:DUF2268 domain-containing putative Zn-dependent protease [Acidobacteriota bacterium]
MSQPMRHFVRMLVIMMSIGAPLGRTDDHLRATAAQSAGANRDPEAAKLVTGDIPNFWRVFDKASLITAGELFQREYIDAGSAGLKGFLANRIVNGRYLAATVAARPRYYAAIRKNSLALDGSPEIKESIRAGFRRLEALYPDAQFPDVYFVIGRLNSAGTTSSDGLLIGVEMNGRDESTPVDELTNWERAVTGRIADLPHIVAHELVHIQQSNAGGDGSTLLLYSLREGGADFIAELASGAHTNRAQHAYGNAHEHELWEEFRKDMRGSDLSHWLFQGDRSTDRPADLGYYIGYKICQAFYRRATDKSGAVQRIIRITDAETFLRESGYAGGAQ